MKKGCPGRAKRTQTPPRFLTTYLLFFRLYRHGVFWPYRHPGDQLQNQKNDKHPDRDKSPSHRSRHMKKCGERGESWVDNTQIRQKTEHRAKKRGFNDNEVPHYTTSAFVGHPHEAHSHRAPQQCSTPLRHQNQWWRSKLRRHHPFYDRHDSSDGRYQTDDEYICVELLTRHCSRHGILPHRKISVNLGLATMTNPLFSVLYDNIFGAKNQTSERGWDRTIDLCLIRTAFYH